MFTDCTTEVQIYHNTNSYIFKYRVTNFATLYPPMLWLCMLIGGIYLPHKVIYHPIYVGMVAGKEYGYISALWINILINVLIHILIVFVLFVVCASTELDCMVCTLLTNATLICLFLNFNQYVYVMCR